MVNQGNQVVYFTLTYSVFTCKITINTNQRMVMSPLHTAPECLVEDLLICSVIDKIGKLEISVISSGKDVGGGSSISMLLMITRHRFMKNRNITNN